MKIRSILTKSAIGIVLAAIAILFVLHILDIRIRYELGIGDFYRYSAALTETERARIRERPIVVGIANDPPLAFTNQYNNYNAGILIDYFSQIGIELGGNVLVKVLSAESLPEALETGSVDTIVTEMPGEEASSSNYGMPLCVVKTQIFVSKSSHFHRIADLTGRTVVALERNATNETVLNRLNAEGVRVVYVDNIYQAFALLSRGDVAGFLGEDMEATHFLGVTNRGSTYRAIGDVLYRSPRSFQVTPDNTELLTILNKGIVELKRKNLIAQTQYRWLGDYDSEGFDLRYIDTAYRVIASILVLVVAFSSWNYVITKRVNTRTRELSESREELRRIIDSISSGLLVVDTDCRIIECNDAIHGMLGLSRDQILGADIRTTESFRPFWEHDKEELLQLQGAYYYVVKQDYVAGKSLLVVEDYTEKHLNEKRARQEAKMVAVGRLSAGLAHEIRNPLGLIRSYSYIIEKKELDEVARHAISVIGDSVRRINSLIENLLRFSKLSNEEVRDVDLDALLQMISELVQIHLTRERIHFEYQISPPIKETVRLNEDVLRMALLNLIQNSIDSLEGMERERKEVKLHICRQSDQLEITLSDNGRGIERSALERVFDPFFSTKEQGTGLGLYIISTELYNNDGNITVESEPGVGTTFRIRLPIKENLDHVQQRL